MGIPRFLSHTFTRYNKCIKEVLVADTILIDGNCVNHIALDALSHKLKVSVEELKCEIKRTYDYYLNLFTFKRCIICLDGKASESKRLTQRERRQDTPNVLSIEMIPGTELSSSINSVIHENYNDDRFLIDDTSNPGEGEHKIIEYIVDKKLNNTIIITSDSDLIILALLKSRGCFVYYLSKKLSVDIDLLKDLFMAKKIYFSLLEIVITCGNDYLPKLIDRLTIEDVEKIFKSKKSTIEFDIDVLLNSLVIFDRTRRCNCTPKLIESYFYQVKWFVACYQELKLYKGIEYPKSSGYPCISCMIKNREIYDSVVLQDLSIESDLEYKSKVLPEDLESFKQRYY